MGGASGVPPAVTCLPSTPAVSQLCGDSLVLRSRGSTSSPLWGGAPAPCCPPSTHGGPPGGGRPAPRQQESQTYPCLRGLPPPSATRPPMPQTWGRGSPSTHLAPARPHAAPLPCPWGPWSLRGPLQGLPSPVAPEDQCTLSAVPPGDPTPWPNPAVQAPRCSCAGPSGAQGGPGTQAGPQSPWLGHSLWVGDDPGRPGLDVARATKTPLPLRGSTGAARLAPPLAPGAEPGGSPTPGGAPGAGGGWARAAWTWRLDVCSPWTDFPGGGARPGAALSESGRAGDPSEFRCCWWMGGWAAWGPLVPSPQMPSPAWHRSLPRRTQGTRVRRPPLHSGTRRPFRFAGRSARTQPLHRRPTQRGGKAGDAVVGAARRPPPPRATRKQQEELRMRKAARGGPAGERSGVERSVPLERAPPSVRQPGLRFSPWFRGAPASGGGQRGTSVSPASSLRLGPEEPV